MRVVIFDPFFKNQSGHCYKYTSSVQSELKKRNISTIILGNVDADPGVLSLENFYPFLTNVTDRVFDETGFVGRLRAVCNQTKLFVRQTNKCIFNNSDFTLEQGDVFFIHTFYEFDFFAMGMFFRQNQKKIIEKNVKLVFLLRFRFVRYSIFHTLLFGLICKFVYGYFLHGLKKQIILCTDSELLKKEYEKLLNAEVRVYPIPVCPVQFKHADLPFRVGDGNFVISFLGATRYSKGFDIFVDMVSELVTDKNLSGKVCFIVQIDVQKQILPDMQKISKKIVRLNELSKANNNINIVEGILSQDCYYTLLDRSNIVVLPYRGKGFKSATSNILVETVVLGKVPVVSDNTWLSYELSKHGLGDLAFRSGDSKSLIETVIKVISGYDGYREKILPVRDEWERYHSSTKLVDILLSANK